jgi:hypothetical protein
MARIHANSPQRRPSVSVLFCIALFLVTADRAASESPLREVIDREILAKWQNQQVTPAPPVDDAAFLRRVYLDLCGTIPTHDEAKAFLDDAASDKRAKLIDRLLSDPRYAQRQADEWDSLFFGRSPPGYDADKRAGFQRWLRDQFAANTPYDKIARAMLRAEGNTVEQGAPMFLVQYRDQPEDATVKITQAFLGVQLQCARCHDHPYESWTQRDFYGFAAFFARLQVIEVGTKDNEKLIVIGERDFGDIKFTGPASENQPGKKGEPVKPKYLRGDVLVEPEPPKDVKQERFPDGKLPPSPQFSRKNALADWITAPGNPYFAKAVTNRVWAQFMGRGLIHPVDNMSESNSPSHPELLDSMTRQLVDRQFDLKWLIRELVNSQTYQLSSQGDVAAERPAWFERARTRPLSAEELAEAWRVAVNYAAVDDKTQERIAKGDRFYPLGEYQKHFLGAPTDGVGNFLGGLHEHLYLSNGGIDRLFDDRPGGLVHALVVAEKDASWESRVERLYLSTLSRRPSPEESRTFVEFLSEGKESPHQRVKEAIWALTTCSEFRFNH